jgi:hypothetical protein
LEGGQNNEDPQSTQMDTQNDGMSMISPREESKGPEEEEEKKDSIENQGNIPNVRFQIQDGEGNKIYTISSIKKENPG